MSVKKHELDVGQNSNIHLATSGVEAVIASHGAFLESLQVDGRELFFPRQDLDGKDRGGVPVCAPIFGPGDHVGLNQHGFARNLRWEIEESENPNEVKFTLVNPRSQDETIPDSYEGCAMYLGIKVGRDECDNPTASWELVVRNYGPEPFVCAPGFHPYFPIPIGVEPEKVEIVYPANSEHRSFDAEEYASVQQFSMGAETVVTTPDYEVSIYTRRLPKGVAWSANPDTYVCVEPTAHGPLTPENLKTATIGMGDERKYSMQITWKQIAA